ncbi:ferredoxin-type protein NapG [Advenella mimigardefordensis]|uniref:Methylamine utilization ferredoxin-type protein MauM n=1 Tax=Advenella mimigardefordensis (strain DSM 17166 / LMG 22922 / DPN7) TaxID=1247726 RepID=W0PDU5_ADVMD|nr:ferredoxin-type protein NapG [Advenella mimigardefordensis]AHG65044.1 methylamine utilization ferredoxin-type protein MauM [Advenella mimigardefordensis DPN7]
MGQEKPSDTTRISEKRRDLLKTSVRAAGALGVTWLALDTAADAASEAEPQALRPPGALDEAAFLSACVRCGLCVRACPYDILSLATLDGPAQVGTPYFIARDDPCRMCKDIPCAKACPTGALDSDMAHIEEADMGVAVLVGHETCLNYKGLNCSICYRVCPVRGEAITLETHQINGQQRIIPTVHSDACTGCGTCEKHCVIREAAIRVLPRKLGLGQEGRNPSGRL